MASKFQLTAKPTFKKKVSLPIPGAQPEKVEFVFHHKTSDELSEYLMTMVGRDIVECLLDILAGWDLEDEFSADNVKKLHQQFPSCWSPINEAYLDELAGIRRKN